VPTLRPEVWREVVASANQVAGPDGAKCEQEEGVEILNRSEDGFEAIIRSRPKSRIRVQ